MIAKNTCNLAGGSHPAKRLSEIYSEYSQPEEQSGDEIVASILTTLERMKDEGSDTEGVSEYRSI